MKKTLLIAGLLGLSVTLSACHTTTNQNGLSSLSVECRTAGFDCVEEQRTENSSIVRSNTTRVQRTERVFSNSLRK